MNNKVVFILILLISYGRMRPINETNEEIKVLKMMLANPDLFILHKRDQKPPKVVIYKTKKPGFSPWG